MNLTPPEEPVLAPPKDDGLSKAASVLTKYIPTETVTFYVAAVAVTPAFQLVFPRKPDQWSYETIFLSSF